MTTKDIMTLSPRTIELALLNLESYLDCYESNLRRNLYPDTDQRVYVDNLVKDLQKAVAELKSL